MPSSSGSRSSASSDSGVESDSASSPTSPSPKRESSSAPSSDQDAEPVTPKRKSRKVATPSTAAPSPNSRAVTPFALPSSPGPSQPVTPDSERELHRVESNLLNVSRDSTPTPGGPRPPRLSRRAKWGERKSTLSKEFVQDSDDEDVNPSPAKSKKKVAIAPTPKDAEEDDEAALEEAAMQDEEGSESDYQDPQELDSDEEQIPAYPPTDPVKPPPTSSMPLVPLSQVSDLPDIPERARGMRQRRWKDADHETFLRSELTTKADMDAFLASRWLTNEDVRRLEATGLMTTKRGKFLESEKRAIREHLKTFQDVHKVTDQGLVDLIMSKGHYIERSAWPTFWFDIAAEVPGRPVRNVVAAVKRMFDPRGRKGMWLPSEDKALLQAHNLYPSQWTKISEAVDRSELDCRDRWRELRDAPTRESGPWSQEETAALEAAVKKACEVAGKDPIKDGVPWDAVVDLMQRKRTALQCRKKWRDALTAAGEYVPPAPHNQRRVDRRKILQRLRELGVEHENDIDWHAVPTKDWEVRPVVLKKVWKELRKRVVVPGRQEMSLPDLMDKIEAGLDEIDARVGESGAARSAKKRALDARPTRAKRMKNKAESMATTDS